MVFGVSYSQSILSVQFIIVKVTRFAPSEYSVYYLSLSLNITMANLAADSTQASSEEAIVTGISISHHNSHAGCQGETGGVHTETEG